MRSQECRKHIQKTGKVCKLSEKTMDEVQKVLEFVEDHSQISDLSTDAAKALMDIPDPVIQQKAISHVANALNRKTPTGGTYKKRLTKPEVEKVIKKVLPPENVKKESCVLKPSVPEKEPEKKKPLTRPEPDHPNHGQFVDQPGTLPVTDAPPQPSLAEQIKPEEPAPVEPAKRVPACLIGPAPVVPMPVPTEKTAKEIYMDACNAAYEHGKPDFRLAIDELMRYHPSWKDAGTVIYFCVTDPKEAIVKKK